LAAKTSEGIIGYSPQPGIDLRLIIDGDSVILTSN
jgi:hypothetical protein